MFLHLSVILFTGGVCASVHAGIHTHPLDRYTPLGRYTPRQVHPLGRYTSRAGTPPHAGTPLLGRYTLPTTVIAADGTHPTGMLSCHTTVLFQRYGQFRGEIDCSRNSQGCARFGEIWTIFT